MADGFFSASVARTAKPKPLAIARCDECGLYRAGCLTPKMPRSGDGRKRILIVSDFPGKTEDEKGYQFAGGSGQYLRDVLAESGIDMRRDCWLQNATRCKSPGGNLDKHPAAVESCRPLVLQDIAETRPTLILLLGGHAIRSVVGHLWGKADVGVVGRWAGARIPAHNNTWVCPSYNPAHALRAKKEGDVFTEREFRRHLRDAARLVSTVPWPDGVPDYPSRVEPILSPTEAARRLARYTGGTLSFDYETTCLKPDAADGEIVCASVCWEGQETIAFPWHGPVVPAMKRLLADPNVAKIAQNAAFEQRWTLEKLGVGVANWVFDTMLAAHAISPRERQKEKGGGVTGLKFLAFSRLGCPDYNSHVEPYLSSVEKERVVRGCYAPNRIREVDPRQVLIYCGLDSLLEYKLAEILSAELGVAW